jgi:small subunit ribosomal protein S29
MSFQTCWRCLSRAPDTALLTQRPIQRPWILLPIPIAPFSTSTPLLVLPAKKKPGVVAAAKNERGVKRTFTKKKDKFQKIERSKRPAIGERKALRKRIVLSNTNALEVQGLQDISAESILDEKLRGQVLGIPDSVVVQLRAVEAFKVTQGWLLYRRPAMLIRPETLDLGREMEQIGSEGSKKTVRRVLVGQRGSGKTVMLLQAMSMAFLKGWVVLNIPEGTHAYIPLFETRCGLQLT